MAVAAPGDGGAALANEAAAQMNAADLSGTSWIPAHSLTAKEQPHESPSLRALLLQSKGLPLVIARDLAPSGAACFLGATCRTSESTLQPTGTYQL